MAAIVLFLMCWVNVVPALCSVMPRYRYQNLSTAASFSLNFPSFPKSHHYCLVFVYFEVVRFCIYQWLYELYDITPIECGVKNAFGACVCSA
jgi:hypothetical protein